MAVTPDPFSPVATGVRVRIRLAPKSSANRLAAITVDGEGKGVIKAMVTAVPEAGKANAALIKILAREWKVAKSSLAVVQGATDRNKTVEVAGETDALMHTLHQWRDHFEKRENTL